jgi:hypothetical protein
MTIEPEWRLASDPKASRMDLPVPGLPYKEL